MRDLSLVQDKPAEFGGSNQGPMASELVLAGLLACQLSTCAKVAPKRRVEMKVQELDGVLEFDDQDQIVRVGLHWTVVSAAEEKAVSKVLELTDRACTISKMLKIPVETDSLVILSG